MVLALASLVLKKTDKDAEPFFMRWMEKLYAPALDKFLNSARIVVIAICIFLGAGLYTASTLGGEFLPKLDEGSIPLQFIRPVSTGGDASTELDRISHSVVLEIPEVKSIFGRLGTAEIALDPMEPNISDTYVMLKPYDEWPKVNGKKRSN